ncbi:MAG: sensor histidine kinase [Bacteroidales bacterium]|nr:sensor histidine kinase [Bacteroidales bacterium]
MKARNQVLLENGIYFLIWIVIFLVPLFGYNDNQGIRWDDVRDFWLRLLPFFSLFLVNNYLLLPFLFLKKKYIAYSCSVLFLIVLLSFFFFSGPSDAPSRKNPFSGQSDMMFHGKDGDPGRKDGFDISRKPEFTDSMAGKPPFIRHGDRPFPDKGFAPHRLAPFRWGPILNNWLLAILLVGCNIAIRLLFKSIRDARRFEELETQTLKAELDYLKAQVNPHFFMNTLNNIHALIDIDAEKAKDTVIELSRIMRYVLYEADKALVPLQKEIEFLGNYISLMRIRFSDDVEITTVYPDPLPDLLLPPLILIPLLENAFKHGISHQETSYIHTRLFVSDGYLSYEVTNSSFSEPAGEKGVGIENLQKRLALLFDSDYVLDLRNEEKAYIAILKIPVK